MLAIFIKELNSIFSSLIGYLAIGAFLLITGVLVWVLPQFSILELGYSSLEPLFNLGPWIFLPLAPAITMNMFSEERQSGTLELLNTKPLTDRNIIGGKYLAALVLIVFSILPTIIYYFSVSWLAVEGVRPDTGGILGSYIGLFFLAATFVAIGLFASSLTDSGVVAFIIAIVLCLIFYWGFNGLSRLPIFFGKSDDLVQSIGIQYHYEGMSRGAIDTRDLLYFLSVIALFLGATQLSLSSRKW